MLDPNANRQSFLGPRLAFVAERARIGIVGLSGGGSHVAQQLAHIGFTKITVFDPKKMEEKHRHRGVGATDADIVGGAAKVDIAARLIRSICPSAVVAARACRWQEEADRLHECDLVFGCVDTFADRQQLEACTRRFLIPYIDVGMDVFHEPGQPPRLVGQIVLSMPGYPCMFCLGLLNDEVLAREGRAYGDIGGRPQVVWANGAIASTAVGLAIDLLTDWSKSLRGPVMLEYDGNRQTIQPDIRVQYRGSAMCTHYPSGLVGPPRFRVI